MQLARLNAMLTATAGGFQKEFESAGNSMKKFGRDAAASSAAADKSASGFAAIKKVLGEESTAGNFLKALQGAGAFAAVGIGARLLSDAAENMNKLNTEFALGKISAGEMSDKLVASVPVLGDLYSAFKSIREIVTGEGIELAAINASIAQQAKTMDAVNAKHTALAGMTSETERYVRGIERSIAEMGMSGLPLELFRIDSRLADQIDAINSKVDAAKNTAISSLTTQIQTLKAQLNTLPAQMQADSPMLKFAEETRSATALLEKMRGEIVQTADAERKTQIEAAAKLAVYQKLNVAAQGFTGWIKTAGEWMERQKQAQQGIADIIDGLNFDAMLSGLSDVEQRIARTRKQLEDLGATQDQIGKAEAAIRAADKAAQDRAMMERMQSDASRNQQTFESANREQTTVSREPPALLQSGSRELTSLFAKTQAQGRGGSKEQIDAIKETTEAVRAVQAAVANSGNNFQILEL